MTDRRTHVVALVLAVAATLLSQLVPTGLAHAAGGDFIPAPPITLPASEPASAMCEWYGSISELTQQSGSDHDGQWSNANTFQSAWVSGPVPNEDCGGLWQGATRIAGSHQTFTCRQEMSGEGSGSGTGTLQAGTFGSPTGGEPEGAVTFAHTVQTYDVVFTHNDCFPPPTEIAQDVPAISGLAAMCDGVREVVNLEVQAFRYSCVHEDTQTMEDGDVYKSRIEAHTALRRTVCDRAVDSDGGGIGDCDEYDRGTSPQEAADDHLPDRATPTPTPTPTPTTQPCPQPPAAAPALAAVANSTVGSTGVRFSVPGWAPSAGFGFSIGFGDGSSGSITPGSETQHFYPRPGEFEASLVMTYPWHGRTCVSSPSTLQVTADPSTLYAPAVHLHPDEDFYPDSVTAFLKSAALIHDRPNAFLRADYLSSSRCKDKVLAAGPNVDLVKLRRTRGATTAVGGSEPRLITQRLGSSSGPYAAKESTVNVVCVASSTRYQADQGGAKKAGNFKSLDDGFVLSLGGASNSVLRGDHTLRDARLYVDFKPGRYVTYWLWYPNNDWRHAGTKRISERHEGDWEHITVRLDQSSNRLSSVGYYQHYCAAKVYPGHELKLEEGRILLSGPRWAGTPPTPRTWARRTSGHVGREARTDPVTPRPAVATPGGHGNRPQAAAPASSTRPFSPGTASRGRGEILAQPTPLTVSASTSRTTGPPRPAVSLVTYRPAGNRLQPMTVAGWICPSSADHFRLGGQRDRRVRLRHPVRPAPCQHSRRQAPADRRPGEVTADQETGCTSPSLSAASRSPVRIR